MDKSFHAQEAGMHILLIHQAFAALDEPGGTRHYEMARFLARHGHRVTILTSPVSYLTGKSSSSKTRWKKIENPEAGITIIRAYTFPALHRSFFHRILSFFSFMFSSFFIGLSVKNVDTVWGTSPPIFQALTAWLLARLKRAGFLLEIRDLWPAFAVAMGVLKNPFLISLSGWLERFLYRHADELVVNSPGFIDHIQQRGGKRITLIPNGVDPSMFRPADKGETFRQKNNLHGAFLVLYAGAHGISNDLEVILSAARLTAEDPRIVYVMVGDGKEKTNQQKLAQEWRLTNIRFLPPVPKNEMQAVLAAADACVAILKPIEMYKTTYPNKVFDYMAAGRPVLCAIDGVIRKVVEEAEGGLFVEPGHPKSLAEAVIQLSCAPQTVERMGRNGRAFIEQNFNRQDSATQMETILSKLSRR